MITILAKCLNRKVKNSFKKKAFKQRLFLYKLINISLKIAIKGDEIIIPIIPKKYPKTNKPVIVVIGCIFILLLIINGCIILPSIV